MNDFFVQLPTAERDWLMRELQQQSADAVPQNKQNALHTFFDARGLPCPMPLLKAKVQLKSLQENQLLYLLASDKNSQIDIKAFCEKNQLWLHQWHSSNPEPVYHFLIEKSA